MEIKFKNGSCIKALPAQETIRSNRGNEQIQKINELYDEQLKYYRKKSRLFLQDCFGVKLLFYQKKLLRMIFTCDHLQRSIRRKIDKRKLLKRENI